MNRVIQFPKGPPRGGLTRVELLVIVLVVGGLVALMLPVINQTRGPSRRTSCQNTLQQLTIGMLNYVDTHKSFPNVGFDAVIDPQNSGSTLPPLTKQVAASTEMATRARYSWLVKVLPYIEEADIASQLVASSKKFSIPAFDPANVIPDTQQPIATFNISTLRCPSDDMLPYASAPEYEQFIAKVAGSQNMGIIGIAPSNYVAMSATELDLIAEYAERANGVIIPVGTVTVADITRGTGQTIMLAETKEPAYSSWYDAGSGWIVAVPPSVAKTEAEFLALVEKSKNIQLLNYGPDDEHPDRVYLAKADWSNQAPRRWGASSEHVKDGVGVVMHAFANGKVEPLNDDIDPRVYRALIDRNAPPGDTPK